MNLDFKRFVGGKKNLVWDDLKVCRVGVSELKVQILSSWILKIDNMVGDLSKLTLKEIKVSYWILLGSQIKIIPELTDLLVKETDCALVSPRSKRTEDEIVSTNTLRL